MLQQIESGLRRRLEVLNGAEAESCLKLSRETAAAVRKEPAFRSALEMVKVLADETRLLTLALLKRTGQLCACEIQAALALSHATVSHHMEQLVESGLVRGERRGKWMHYSLAEGVEAKIP